MQTVLLKTVRMPLTITLHIGVTSAAHWRRWVAHWRRKAAISEATWRAPPDVRRAVRGQPHPGPPPDTAASCPRRTGAAAQLGAGPCPNRCGAVAEGARSAVVCRRRTPHTGLCYSLWRSDDHQNLLGALMRVSSFRSGSPISLLSLRPVIRSRQGRSKANMPS